MSYLTGDSLLVRIRIAFGASIAADPATWAWTDVTDWWHTPDDVTITWGRTARATEAETSTLTLTLKNTDGRFTAYDPRSPYWPNVRKWTPIEYDVDLDDGAGWRNRFSGFIRKLPLTWPGASPFMALAPIQASGVLGRLGRGKPPARSPLRRTIGASGPAAYWPVEDDSDATQAASVISGGQPLAVVGAVEFTPVGDYTIFTGTTTRYGTTAVANLKAGGSLRAQLTPPATALTAAAWTVGVVMQVDTLSTLSADVVIMEWETAGGTYTRWQLKVTTTLRTQVVGITSGGSSTLLIDVGSATPEFTHYAASASISGGTVTVSLYRGSSAPVTTTFGGTLGGVSSMAVNPTGSTSTGEMPAGHLAVWAAGAPPIDRAAFFDSYGGLVREARRSWLAETATDRLARLCAEDGVPLTMPAVPADAVQRMGWQPVNAPPALRQECEAVDGGLTYESGFGLGYLPRASRYNAPVTLTIDAAAGQLGTPYEPVDDEQILRNRWTVERVEGSSAIASDEESIDTQGEIEDFARLNLSTDLPLPDQAQWRLHLTTLPEPRYPAVPINVAAHRELAADWCACMPGSRMQVVNPPAQNVPGTVDQLVVGATETFRGRRYWRATLNVEPARPWIVGEYDDGVSRYDTVGSELTAPFTAGTDTVMSVLGPNWSDADLPLDVDCGGVRLRVTAITGSLPQAFTVDLVPVNGISKTIPAGTPVRLWQPAVYAL